MIFYKHPKIITQFCFTINNSTTEQIYYFNILGVALDQNITWNPHVDKISITISRITGLLRKLQHYFPKHILITIYNSLIHSHLLHYKNINNLLPGYVRIFGQFLTMYGDHNYDFRNAHFRLPMTKRDLFVKSTKYQHLKLIQENNHSDLDSRCTVPIFQFMYHIKSYLINEYDPVCNIAC